MEVIQWFQKNWQDLLAVYTALVAAASIVVRFTPTLKDDNWLLAVVKFVGKYIALNRSTNDAEIRSQAKPEEPKE